MYVICLLIILIVELFISHITSKGVLLSPHFGFTLSFIPQVMLACFYTNEWQFDLEMETFFVICGGVFLFMITSCFFNKFKPTSLIKNREAKIDQGEPRIVIRTWKLVIITIIQVSALLLSISYLLSLSPGTSLGSAILYYRYTNLFAEDSFIIPFYTRMLRTFCVSAGFVFTYLLIHHYHYKDTINKPLIILNIVLSSCNDMIFGARTGIAILGIATIVQYYFIVGRNLGWKRVVSFNFFLRIVMAGSFFIGTFQLVAELMGRTLASSYSYMDYIAGYLSAELRNLNTFIKAGFFGSTIDNNQTLNGIIPFLSRLLDHPEWIHKLDLPFIIEGGYNYGNVYTIFYSFIYDMGYVGVLLYVPLMAMFCSRLYNKVLEENTERKISVYLIAYSYVYFTILFSFFSNKFYETIFNTKFIWTLVSWVVLKCFFMLKLKIRKG